MDHDFCDTEGAKRLKQKIEDYWRERGCAVEVELHKAGFAPAMRSARVDVRSELVNGLPPGGVSRDVLKTLRAPRPAPPPPRRRRMAIFDSSVYAS